MESSSKFGFSIAKTGDLHKDGLEDFAVGAPGFDEGKGAVFIFHGCTDFKFDHYQVLKAQDFNFPVKSGFGYSLSKEISDVDSNGFTDLAVGAPLADAGSAIILRSRPVIDFKSQVIFPNLPDINPDQKSMII